MVPALSYFDFYLSRIHYYLLETNFVYNFPGLGIDASVSAC